MMPMRSSVSEAELQRLKANEKRFHLDRMHSGSSADALLLLQQAQQQPQKSNALAAAAKQLLSTSGGAAAIANQHGTNKHRNTNRPTSPTVNGMPSLTEELARLFNKEDEDPVANAKNPHRRLFPLSASAAHKQKIWVGQQNYKAATRSVALNPSFRRVPSNGITSQKFDEMQQQQNSDNQ